MRLSSLNGGIHPDSNKYAEADNLTLFKVEEGEEFFVPFIQHIGSPAKCIIKKGQAVIAGELLAEAGQGLSVPVHAPADGVVTAISKVLHPTFGLVDGCILKATQQSGQYMELPSSDSFVAMVKAAGIVGLGGAGFPSSFKIENVRRADTLLINASECEPYLTCDYALMLNYPEEIIAGAKLIKDNIKVPTAIIAVEDNKKKAILKLCELSAGSGIDIVSVPSKYPQGGEKQLINTVLSRTVPQGRLPLDIGVLIHNVATVRAIYEAVEKRKPLFERVITLSGLVENPCNVLAPIGVSAERLFSFTGNSFKRGHRLVFGGPMTGTAVNDIKTPAVKTTGGILLLEERFFKNPEPCIRCGRCIKACVMNLVPTELERIYASGDIKMMMTEGLMACIECGCCTYVCPSGRLLAESIKTGKKRAGAIIAAGGKK